MSSISATYFSHDFGNKIFTVNSSNPRYKTTNGKTTGPSEHVLNAGQIDIDKPSDAKILTDGSGEPTYLSKLRTNLTGVQDDINEFLTEQMESAKKKKSKLADEKELIEEKRIEEEINELLDGGDSDSEDVEDN